MDPITAIIVGVVLGVALIIGVVALVAYIRHPRNTWVVAKDMFDSEDEDKPLHDDNTDYRKENFFKNIVNLVIEKLQKKGIRVNGKSVKDAIFGDHPEEKIKIDDGGGIVQEEINIKKTIACDRLVKVESEDTKDSHTKVNQTVSVSFKGVFHADEKLPNNSIDLEKFVDVSEKDDGTVKVRFITPPR